MIDQPVNGAVGGGHVLLDAVPLTAVEANFVDLWADRTQEPGPLIVRAIAKPLCGCGQPSLSVP